MTNCRDHPTRTPQPDFRPNPGQETITMHDGRWRLGITTLHDADLPVGQYLEIARIDPNTNVIHDVLYLPREQTEQLRDILLETLGPPRACLECPFTP